MLLYEGQQPAGGIAGVYGRCTLSRRYGQLAVADLVNVVGVRKIYRLQVLDTTLYEVSTIVYIGDTCMHIHHVHCS